MQQTKRTAARVILGNPQSLYFWPSIGLRWPKRKGAAEHCAYVPIAARPQPTVMGWGRLISQIGHPERRTRPESAMPSIGGRAEVRELALSDASGRGSLYVPISDE